MSQQSWAYDAPSGAYKDHKFSSRVFSAAIAETKTMQFVTPLEGGFGEHMGGTANMVRVANLDEPTSAVLDELAPIPEDAFSISVSSFNLQEIGRKVPWTRRAAALANFDMPAEIIKKLQDQMSLVMDALAIAAFKSCKVKAIPNGAASIVFDTDGTASTTATVNVGYYHIEQIRDQLYSTYHVPTFPGDEYFCLASTKALRGLKSDSDFETWNKYTTPEMKAKGEVGKIEGIRFVEVNNVNILSGSLGSGSVLGEMIFFGADSVRFAAAVMPEIFRETPQDGGRSHKAGWYGDIGFGEVFPTANAGEARIIHVTSA